MQLGDIVKVIKAQWINPSLDSKIDHLLTDSRLLIHPAKTLFFAIKGPSRDGHDYVIDLYNKGVKSFVVSKPMNVPADASLLVVSDTLSALQNLAAYHRNQFQYPVIAITGSNGKTTLKEWLYTLLSGHKNVVKSPKSFNSQIGVPLSIWNMTAAHNLGVFETGISRKGEMQNLAAIIRPDLGIFTNLGAAHDEGFQSRHEKLVEKSLLFKECRRIICCADHSPIFDYLTQHHQDKVISWTSHSDVSATYTFTQSAAGWEISRKGEKLGYIALPFDLPIWIENVMHAIVCALEVGLAVSEIKEKLSLLKPLPMRLEVKEGINGCYLIDDTYSNDLSGLAAALDFLQQQKQRKIKTVVLSDLPEAGSDPSEIYHKVQALLKEHQINRLITIGDQAHQYLAGYGGSYQHFQSVEAFLSYTPTFSQEMILIKGARKLSLERISEALQARHHRTTLEINFEAIIQNLNVYKAKLAPGTKIMAMVKAFAYGGGSKEIANLLQYHGVHYLGVAYVDEAVELRKNGITLPIMVMNPDASQLALMAHYDIEGEIYDSASLLNWLMHEGPLPKAHIKIETGMNRLGFTPHELTLLLEKLSGQSDIQIAGIFTHLAAAEDPSHDAFTRLQLQRFEETNHQIVAALGYQPLRHVLNSSGMLRWPTHHYEMVRIGIGLYGHDPVSQLPLRPVTKLKTAISQIKDVPTGETVGYGRKGQALTSRKIAIVPIGYADGYGRWFGLGRGKMQINGKLYPTIGNICMDMTMIDITGSDDLISNGAEVTVFGDNPTIEQLANWAGTIPYEILTSISQRVRRIYLSE